MLKGGGSQSPKPQLGCRDMEEEEEEEEEDIFHNA
jgi:hypothetical protein